MNYYPFRKDEGVPGENFIIGYLSGVVFAAAVFAGVLLGMVF